MFQFESEGRRKKLQPISIWKAVIQEESDLQLTRRGPLALGKPIDLVSLLILMLNSSESILKGTPRVMFDQIPG
jgi:hypothetical protein